MTEPTRSMILADNSGDTRIGWDEEQDDNMRALIEKKMQQGMIFFILKPVVGGMWYRRKKIKSVDDIKDREVRVKDADFQDLFLTGKIGVDTQNSGGNLDAVRRSRDPAEVARGHSIGMRPLAGG